MEIINCFVDDGTGKKYDELLKEVCDSEIPQLGNVLDITNKDKGTVGGQSIVLISFIGVVNGKAKRLGAVTTTQQLLNAAKFIEAKHKQKQQANN